jgi:hypothetical protein
MINNGQFVKLGTKKVALAGDGLDMIQEQFFSAMWITKNQLPCSWFLVLNNILLTFFLLLRIEESCK